MRRERRSSGRAMSEIETERDREKEQREIKREQQRAGEEDNSASKQ